MWPSNDVNPASWWSQYGQLNIVPIGARTSNARADDFPGQRPWRCVNELVSFIALFHPLQTTFRTLIAWTVSIWRLRFDSLGNVLWHDSIVHMKAGMEAEIGWKQKACTCNQKRTPHRRVALSTHLSTHLLYKQIRKFVRPAILGI